MNKENILIKYGANAKSVDELIEYTKNNFRHTGFKNLDDEMFATSWSSYQNSFDFLREVIVEFNFPIKKGISKTAGYRSATEEGLIPDKYLESDGLDLKTIYLDFVKTPGGKVPLLILEDRDEFEKVIQAFSYKNEPGKVPKSMGASTYANYNNWYRVKEYKKNWLSIYPYSSELDWSKEFDELERRPQFYQDTFIVLSNGPYSSVDHSLVGLKSHDWQELSIEIRKYHETCHYFTKRVLSSMNNNIIDEIFCDFVGLVKSTGKYNLDWALLFLGLEGYPKYRKGGRLENYASVDSLKSKKILIDLVYDAMRNMHDIYQEGVDPYLAIYAFSYFSLLELAATPNKVLKKFEELTR